MLFHFDLLTGKIFKFTVKKPRIFSHFNFPEITVNLNLTEMIPSVSGEKLKLTKNRQSLFSFTRDSDFLVIHLEVNYVASLLYITNQGFRELSTRLHRLPYLSVRDHQPGCV